MKEETMLMPFRLNPIAFLGLIVPLATLLLPAPSWAVSPDISTAEPPLIRVEGDTVYYSGGIGLDSAKTFLEVVESAAGLRRLVINSGGGDTITARVIGRWVAEHGLDVEVVGGCFSSCANYIFVAGKNKIITKDAFVGWHGSEIQFEVLAESFPGKSAADLEEEQLREAMAAGLTEETIPDATEMGEEVARLLEDSNASRQDEAEFFQELGVDIELTVHGLRSQHLHQLEASDKPGWTYSIADMARFGVTDVVYLGRDRYEDSASVQKYLVVLPVLADCCKIPEKSGK